MLKFMMQMHTSWGNTMDQIRGLFITMWDPTSIPFEHYARMGCTDIFCNGAYLGSTTDEYNSLVTQLRNVISACEGTDLNIWCDSTVFETSTQGVWTDPTDSTHEALIASQLAQLFIDVPELAGVTFDDYNWQPYNSSNPTQAGHWPNSDSISTNEPELEQSLADFASEMATIVHSANKKLGAFIPSAINTLGANTSLLEPIFDFISPEIYIYDPTINTKSWIDGIILGHSDVISDPNKLIPGLSTYNITSQLPLSVNSVTCEIESALTCNTGGYILFQQNTMNNDIIFLSYSDFELNIGLSMDKGNVIPEKSSRKLTVTLTDQNGNPIPDAIIQNATGSYKLIDKATKTVLVESTPFNITGNIATIPLSSTQNSMIHNLNSETHAIVVTVNYGNGQEENCELDITIQRIAGL